MMFNQQIGAKGILGRGFPDGPAAETASHYSGVRTGWAFRLRHLAETAARNRRSDWDAIFQWGPRGNCGPESALETGRGFPEDRNSRPPLDKMIRSLRRMRNIQGVSQGAGTIGTSPAAGSISPQQQKPALATNVTCAGLVGAHKGTLLRPTSVMDYRTAPARDASVGLPSDEDCRSLRLSAQCRQSADTAK